MPGALERLCERAEAAVAGGYNIIILSDRQVGPDRIAIPALLATAAVHHHLIRKGLRTSVGLVVESGEPREVHHFCCLAGYGAEAINPYLAFDTLLDMHKRGEMPKEVDAHEVVYRYIKSIGKGILKVMSKMGISTYQSYCGAQIFDAVGLKSDFVEKYFTGTATHDRRRRAGGDRRRRRSAATPTPSATIRCCATRSSSAANIAVPHARRGHIWSPDTVATLQHAVRKGSLETFSEYLDADRQRDRAGADHPRPVQDQAGGRHRPQAGAARRGRAGQPTSSSASRPARCRSARSRARRTRRWRAP